MNHPDSNTALEAWLDRPMTESEQQQFLAQPGQPHRVFCFCQTCSDKRRAAVAVEAYNQPRLLSHGENNAIALFDFVGGILLGIFVGFVIGALLVRPLFDAMGGR